MGLEWGNNEVIVGFQGLEFRFSGLDCSQTTSIATRFSSYLRVATEGRPFARLRCRMGLVELPAAGFASPLNEYTPKPRHRADGVSVRGYNFRLDGTLTDSELLGDVYTEHAAALAGVDVLDNVLRLAAAYAALAEGGLLMHSAGVVMDGAAWLMLGRSNAGKSTLAGSALAAGRPILSDDINLLRPDGAGGFVSGAVPLTGDLRAHQIAGPDARFPVRGLLWLSQADTLAIEPMSAGEATSRLPACCPVVNTDPFRLERVFSVIDRVLSVLPMHTLNFRRDDPFEAIEAMVLGAAAVGRT